MAAAARLLAALAWLLLSAASPAHGLPAILPDLHVLSPRADLQVNVSSNGTVTVWNGNATVAQGSASDGGGSDFDAPAVLWIVYCFLLGVPLALGGLRLPRSTTGIGIGLTVTVCLWTAFVNTESAKNLPELVITLIPMLLFVPGFLFGAFEYGRLAGIILIAVASGFSWGVRICLFGTDLAVREIWGAWLIGASFAFVNVILIPYWERLAMAIAASSVGTFFLALGIDLSVNKQLGMSFGLRYAFDRNPHHFYDIVYAGWKPPTSTIIIMAVSLGVIPIVTFAQYRFYPRLSFWRRPGNEHGETASFLEEKAAMRITVHDVSTPSVTNSRSSLPNTDSNWASQRQSVVTDF